MDFAKAIEAEGIPIGHHYGCLISTWPWAEPYLSDKFVAKNAIATRDSCFHLYLNENMVGKKYSETSVSTQWKKYRVISQVKEVSQKVLYQLGGNLRCKNLHILSVRN